MIKNILNIVGWVGTALVVAAVGLRFAIWAGVSGVNPMWDRYAFYGALAGLACVVLYTLGQWREIADYFRRRNARYGAIASVSVLVFLAILVALNYLSFRQNKRWDLTKNKQYTLSDQTVKLLQNLDSPVKFLVFDRADSFDRFRISLEQYKYQWPRRLDVQDIDADMLQRFLAKGGHVMVLVDPPDEKAQATPVIDAFLKDWDFQADKDIVVDASGMGQLIGTDASVPIVASYPSHPITERFNLITAFPLARSITPILPASKGRAAVPIIQTSARSWAETDMNQLKSGRVELNADKGDKAGPVTIGAVTATNATDAPKDASKPDQRPPESRFVTIGDSDFAANYAIRIQGNQDLFLNTINWLAQQENLISIRPKAPSDSRLTITQRQATAVLWMSLLAIPALVFGTGVYTWWRKR